MATRREIKVGDVFDHFVILEVIPPPLGAKKGRRFAMRCLRCDTIIVRIRKQVTGKNRGKKLLCSTCTVRRHVGTCNKGWICTDAWYDTEVKQYYVALVCEVCGARQRLTKRQFLQSNCRGCSHDRDGARPTKETVSPGRQGTRDRMRRVYADYRREL